MFSGYKGQFNPSVPLVIASGQTVSAVLPTGGFTICGIAFPATFTGTAVTFQVCDTASGTFVPLYNSAGVVSYTVAQGHFVAFNPNDFQGAAFLKVVSGSTEGAARTLTCSMKGL